MIQETNRNGKILRGTFQTSVFLLRMAFAMFMSFIAQMIPQLQTYYRVAIDQTGLFMTFQSLGGIVFLFLGARLVDRIEKRWLLLIGGVCLAAFLCISSVLPALAVMFLFLAVIGCANAVIDTMSNAITGEMHSENRGPYLSLLNAFFSIGAISGPFFAEKLFQKYGLHQVFFIFGGAVAIIVAIYLTSMFLMRFERGTQADNVNSGEQRKAEHISAGINWGFTIRVGVIIFLTAAATITLMTWLSMYTTEQFQTSRSSGALALSLFWAGRIAGLLMSTKISSRIKPKAMIFWCALAGAAFLLCGLSLKNLTVFFICITLTGMLFGNCEPQAMALTMEFFPGRAGYAATVFAIIASCSVIAIPYLVGLLLGHFGLQAGMYAACAFMLLLAAATPLAIPKPQKETLQAEIRH